MNNKLFPVIVALLVGYCVNAAAWDAPSPVEEEKILEGMKRMRNSAKRSLALSEFAGNYLSIGRIDRAANAYRSIINDGKISKQDKYEYYIIIADMFVGARQFSPAIEFYQEAISVMPGLEAARLKLVKIYEQSDLNELAKLEYQECIKYNRRSFEANFGLAALFMKMGLNTQAMEHYRQALAIKSDPELYRKAAHCAENSGDISIACAMLRQIPVEKRIYEDIISLGRLYAESGRIEDAEESFSQAIKMDTDNVDGYVQLALLYMDNNEPLPAEKLLGIALEKAPEEGSLHFFMGCNYATQNKYELSLLEMKKAGSFARSAVLEDYSLRFQNIITKLSR